MVENVSGNKWNPLKTCTFIFATKNVVVKNV